MQQKTRAANLFDQDTPAEQAKELQAFTRKSTVDEGDLGKKSDTDSYHCHPAYLVTIRLRLPKNVGIQ